MNNARLIPRSEGGGGGYGGGGDTTRPPEPPASGGEAVAPSPDHCVPQDEAQLISAPRL